MRKKNSIRQYIRGKHSALACPFQYKFTKMVEKKTWEKKDELTFPGALKAKRETRNNIYTI